MSTLDVITEALKASSGAPGQGASGMKRIVLIRDRYTAMGIGLAFVEFVDTEVGLIDLIVYRALMVQFQSASSLLAATMSTELHPEGFRISNRPVAASFANPGSFAPLAPHSLRDESCIMGSTAMGGVEGVFAKYWDESTSVVEISFEVAQSAVKKEVTVQGDKKKKRKAKEEDASTFFVQRYRAHFNT
jgi:RNA-binding protein 5/10